MAFQFIFHDSRCVIPVAVSYVAFNFKNFSALPPPSLPPGPRRVGFRQLGPPPTPPQKVADHYYRASNTEGAEVTVDIARCCGVAAGLK